MKNSNTFSTEIVEKNNRKWYLTMEECISKLDKNNALLG